MENPKLPSTVAETITEYPKFRILVIGKSGVGKSSLIDRVFNVDIANVSHQRSGRSDIEREYSSPHNTRFVLHDSQGFEPGSEDNFKIVKGFIERRTENPVLKDRLHAVWLCIEIPRAGGRLFDTGDEELLRLDLKVPVIVVFTKYDLLVAYQEKIIDDAELGSYTDDEQVAQLIEKKAESAFKTLCTDKLIPLRQKLPYAKVSNKNRHHSMLSDLITTTRDCLRELEGEFWVVWAIAQRANVQVNIDGSIDIGMRRYWLDLASGADFPGNSLADCLYRIYTDIVKVWNFHDPEELLAGDNFKAMVMKLIDELGPEPSGEDSDSSDTLTKAQAFVAILGPLAAAFAQVAAALGLTYIFVRFLRDVYHKTQETLRCLMACIVDVTLVLDRLFWNTFHREPPSPLSMNLIESAFYSYQDSPPQKEVHRAIREYVATTFATGSDNAHQKVIKLINLHRISPVTK